MDKYARRKKQKKLNSVRKRLEQKKNNKSDVSQQMLEYEKVLQYIKESYILDELDKIHMENMRSTLENFRNKDKDISVKKEFENIFKFIIRRMFRRKVCFQRL